MIILGKRNFNLNKNTKLYLSDFQNLRNRLQYELKNESGFEMQFVDKKPSSNFVEIEKVEGLLDEEYRLVINESGISVKSFSYAGAYYAL